MSSDLVAFLRARLDEDEQAAKAWLPLGNPDDAARVHPARHDPGRALREVDAKRRQIELCKYMAGWTDEHNPRVSQHEMASMRIAAEQMFLLLAVPYADHPECRDEWLP